MRLARLRHLTGGGAFHAMSRFADSKAVFDVENASCPNANYFLKLMRKLEAFHGMKIITYTLMSTHFHLLVCEPAHSSKKISDAELVAKIRALNGSTAAAELAWQLKHLRVELKSPAAAEELKMRYLKRMGNISNFIQDLKGRFAQWYNRRKGRYGVLWADRFKSVLVEGGTATWTMAAYIDLNCVRAGLADDPKDYRWCGYGEATAGGSQLARTGLMEVFAERGELSWKQFARDYRKLLFTEGEQKPVALNSNKRPRRGIAAARVQEVLDGNGELTLGELVRCRVRYFADGLALGSAEFIEKIFDGNRGHFGEKRKDGARRLRGGDYEGLRTLRDLRKSPLG